MTHCTVYPTYCANHYSCLPLNCRLHRYIITFQLTSLSVTSYTCKCVVFQVYLSSCMLYIYRQTSLMCLGVCLSDRINKHTQYQLQLRPRRKPVSTDSEVEYGLSSLGSKLWTAWEFCCFSIGLVNVKATPEMDNKVRVYIYIYIYLTKIYLL